MFENNQWVYAVIVFGLVIVIVLSILKYREATKYTIEEEIRDLKRRNNVESGNNRVNQLNSQERYKTNKPKTELYTKDDSNRMIKNIRSMHKQGIISEQEYKEQIAKVKRGEF